ncbi:photosystem I assembly protein Ycf4 [Gloeobacter violaceus]|uniref:Photosystem I assembly protein Ycf4 n=1 Tax=Gloeobacter violaceus (strain ATCC 29082 / PCC 7421) TaxID=251221 RepID=YCF4_GLOVI|nr:photosystem I assembly protein Ycf4 [Gloeobacter violaceus]Q7NPH6.1 RecName: Full=Photosystem I assembly protein Ycf4 [Gloeobacter violaceus PCC 7421]BAC88020.1 ycf4 [Gloeobacter violaceus PCC 7421]
MAAPAIYQTDKVLRFEVPGSRRPSTYFFALVLTLGGLGFLFAGLSPFVETNLLPFSDTRGLTRFPQGVTMIFYGALATLFSLYYWLVLALDVGSGYNEFDKQNKKVTLFRRGFPGKNRIIEIVHPLENILGLKVQIKEGLNPRRAYFLKLKGARDLRLSPVGQPQPLAAVEDQVSAIARFLNIGVEGI